MLQDQDIIYYNPGINSKNIVFNVKQIPAEDIANLLADHQRIIVRAGDLCAKIIHRRLKIPTLVRVSFGIYTTKADLDTLIQGLQQNF